ncbi:DNA gyrase C-terminal beta-propeller domain-containing protein [Escherichia coli]
MPRSTSKISITPEDVVVTLSHQGYVKYQPLSDYEAQRRGGRGKSATRIKEEDFVERLLVANTHYHPLPFSTRGKGLLAQGVSIAGGVPWRPRSSDHQPATAG